MSVEMLSTGEIDTTKYVLEIPTTQPLFFNFSWNFKTQLVCLFPGDTLAFSVNENEQLPFVFNGTRPSQELMFYSELERESLGFLASSINYDMEITERLDFKYVEEKTYERYQRKLNLLHVKSNSGMFSKLGFSTISKSLYYQYLTELLFPYQPWKPIAENKKNDAFIPSVYRDKLNELIFELSNDSLMYLLDYRRFILAYSRFLTIQSYKSTDIDLTTHLNYCTKSFSGKIRDCILFDEVYGEYQKSGEISYFEPVLEYLRDEHLRNRLIQIQNKEFKEFSVEALDTELIDSDNNRTTLRDFLIKGRGKSVYLDFWATWCRPCLIEMPYSAELIKEFEDTDIILAYISIDEDHHKWLRKLNTLPRGNNVYHFILADDSKLKDEVNVPPIPKYILINRKSVVHFNAPRPRSGKIRKLILEN